jgi:hypothetical protein
MSALSNAVLILRWLGQHGPEAGVSEVAAALVCVPVSGMMFLFPAQ